MPKYPYPIDRALAQTGAGVWPTANAPNATGRAAGAPARSSRSRRSAPTAIAWTCGRRRRPRAYNAFGEGRSWKFSKFRSTNGYVAMPLDGLWLTGPFLHNGSVPSLADLLEPVEARPRTILARLRRATIPRASAS